MDTSSIFAKSIRSSAASGTLSHAIILSGPGNKTDAVTYLASAFLCAAESGRPCLQCNSCRKVRERIHPDLIYVEDDAHKEIPVDLIRSMRQDVYVLPNEGERKVYVFSNCDQLNEKDQNVLLKIVEEGPPYAVFVFCVESSSSLLETIRSRCVEYKSHDEPVNPELGDALSLMQVLAKRNIIAAAEYIFSLEKQLKRDQLQDLLSACWFLSSETLLYMSGKTPEESLAEYLPPLAAAFKTKKRTYRLVNLFDKYNKECHFNINVGQVLGAMLSELEEIL